MTESSPGNDPVHRIPKAHSIALRLKRAGVEDDLIAECLDVEPEGVPLLLQVAAAKLAHTNQPRDSASSLSRFPPKGSDPV